MSLEVMSLFVDRYDSVAEEGWRARAQLLLCHPWADDGRHCSQRVPGVRHSRGRNVWHQVGHNSSDSFGWPYGNTRRWTTGTCQLTPCLPWPLHHHLASWYIRFRDVMEPANIRIRRMRISCAKSVGFGCEYGFVVRSKLPAITATVI